TAAFPTDIISRCFTTELVIDETGVGRAVGDIFNEAGLKPIKVTITAGNEEARTVLRASRCRSRSWSRRSMP
ncbi:MAG: hypothetical protein WA683_12310, partial [Pseudolabrys sp.]